jgi:hypothetical protein
VAVEVLLRRLGRDEFLVEEPADGAASGTGVAQGLPGRDELSILVEQVLEPTERASPLQGPAQSSPIARSLTRSAKSTIS